MAKKSRYMAYAEGVREKSRRAENKSAVKPPVAKQNMKTGSVVKRLSQMKERAKELDEENKKKKEEK